MAAVRVSLCVSCMGRLHHLRKTLPRNIACNADYSEVEFVLLDYNSPDGLEAWVKEEMMEHIRSGKLVYYKEHTAECFLHSHARNLSFKLATGEVVCNVDADNFTGKGFAAHLGDLFAPSRSIFVIPPAGISAGMFGRISMRKSDFLALGGYNEKLVYGLDRGEDPELISRARRKGIREARFDGAFSAAPLQHSDRERTKYTRPGKEGKRARIRRGEIVANDGVSWGAASVVKNFSETIHVS